MNARVIVLVCFIGLSLHRVVSTGDSSAKSNRFLFSATGLASGTSLSVLKDSEASSLTDCTRQCSENHELCSVSAIASGQGVRQCITYSNTRVVGTVGEVAANWTVAENFTDVGDALTKWSYALDCSELYSRGFTTDGQYLIRPDPSQPVVKVWCDMTDSPGGWTVFFKRYDDSVNFHSHNWAGYKAGFGDASGEYFIGLETLHGLTQLATTTLKVDLWGNNNAFKYAEYSSFAVGAENTNYLLTISGYQATSTVQDELVNEANGMGWTTSDSDNDNWGGNCATQRQGGWWWNGCGGAHMFGPFNIGVDAVDGNFYWRGFYGNNYVGLQAGTMKIRRDV